MITGGTSLEPELHLSTREELLKRVQELGVVGRSRMNKADLAIAIARKEADRAAADLEMQAIEQRVREITESATPQIERIDRAPVVGPRDLAPGG